MSKEHQKFRRPVHTEVEGARGKVLVSTIHYSGREFETMVFPIKDGRPQMGAPLNCDRTYGEGQAQLAHVTFCNIYEDRFPVVEYRFVRQGKGIWGRWVCAPAYAFVC